MAPRPNSSIISYLPAFVCVVILSSSGAGKRPFVFFLVHAHDRGLASVACGKDTAAHTHAPYLRQYPANFLLVNATGVLVFRTRQVQVLRLARPWSFGGGIDSPRHIMRSGAGTVVSPPGRPLSPALAGPSNSSLSNYPSSAIPFLHVPWS